MAAVGLDNTQFGNTMSIYGVAATILYFPGGWIADRIAPRALMAFSLVATGLIGFWYATFPPYLTLMIISVLWALTTVLTFWATVIKAVNMLGDSSEQGKLFGLLEGGRGVACSITALGGLWIFSRIGASAANMGFIVRIESSLIILAGILAWIFVPNADMKKEVKASTKEAGSAFKDVLKVIKMPEVWLIAGTIFTTYTIFAAQSYITPYMTDVFGLSLVVAGVLGILRSHVIRAIAAPIGGYLTKFTGGSSAKVLRYGYMILIVCLIAFLLIPGTKSLLILMVITMLTMSATCFAMRGVYFALVDEVRTPVTIVGTVVGFASFIGFIPDAYIYTLIGKWLDTYKGALGYKIMFGYMLGVEVVGLIIITLLIKQIAKINGRVKIQEEGTTTI